MKKTNIILFLILWFNTPLPIFAQSDSLFTFLKIIKGNYDNFDVDNLDNIFLLNQTNQLKKINANGDSISVFNDVKRYGNLSYIDVTNPLKILLYYKDFATIVVLDRFLNIRNSIDCRKQNIFSVQSIATSYDNNIWIFDDQDYKLKKIDENGTPLQETTDFRLLFDSTPLPTKIIDKEGFVYLYDTEKGFYIFDYYGSFKNKLSFFNWENIAASKNILYGFNKNKLYSYQLNSFILKEYPLPSFLDNFISIKAINEKIYLLKNDGLYIYLIK